MYIVFGGVQYYPDGGANDFIGIRTDINDAIALAESFTNGDEYAEKWAHVFSVDEEGVVARFGVKPYGEQ